MKKSIIFIMLFFLTISCKNNLNSDADSGLTSITMNDITKDLNAEMKKNNSTKDLTINFVTLSLSPKNTNGCTDTQRVPKTTVEQFNTDENNKKFTLKTKNTAKETCLYTLKMQYGAKDTVYFEGETSIGEGKNSYTGKDTKVYISLTFKPNGTKLDDIPIADLSGETSVTIIPSIEGSGTTMELKGLINDFCKHIRDVEIFSSNSGNPTNKTLNRYAFIVQGNSSQCLNTEVLQKHGFKENQNTSGSFTNWGPDTIYNISVYGLTPNTDYTIFIFTLGSDYDSDKKPLYYKGKSSDTFSINSENLLRVGAYNFTYKSPTELSFIPASTKTSNYRTRIFTK